MSRYAMVVVVEADSPGAAWEFASGSLIEGPRRDHSPAVDYIGEPWQGLPTEAEDITTDHISLRISVPSSAEDGSWHTEVRHLSWCD